MLFQIHPAGSGAPLIDPKPILDGWVELEDSSIYRARGENPFLSTSPTPGQALLESAGQLQQQVLRDQGISLPGCERGEISSGRIDRRVLAALEFLSTAGLRPGVSALGCGHTPATNDSGASVEISSINGVPVAGESVPGSPVAQAIERLHGLQGTMKPLQISSPAAQAHGHGVSGMPSSPDAILVSYSAGGAPGAPGGAAAAHIAGSLDTPLNADQWVKLIARLGQVPNPTVRAGRSAAAIPDPVPSTSTALQGGALQANGNH
jgi:hypothetical protein